MTTDFLGGWGNLVLSSRYAFGI